MIQNPDDEWMLSALGEGLLYKAEAGDDDDRTPLIDFLQWLNESSDEEFAADLADHLDVDAFATYLAFQELVSNSDDIDGPGNNSYLYYDPDAGTMTVVNWDLNLAFGASPGGGGGGGAGGDGGAAGGAAGRPDAGARGGGMGGGMGGSNVLAERFLANADFSALVDAETERLQADLIDSGVAADVLTAWTETLTSGASDLVSTDVITQESDALAAKIED